MVVKRHNGCGGGVRHCSSSRMFPVASATFLFSHSFAPYFASLYSPCFSSFEQSSFFALSFSSSSPPSGIVPSCKQAFLKSTSLCVQVAAFHPNSPLLLHPSHYSNKTLRHPVQLVFKMGKFIWHEHARYVSITASLCKLTIRLLI